MGHILLGAVNILLAVQAPQATVTGTVRDGAGERLAGAIVTLTDLSRAAATDADGRYVLRQVPAGPQHLTVRLIGHAPRQLHALVPRDGQLEINVSLRPEPFRLPPVEVRPLVSVRGVESDSTTFPDRRISLDAVWSHPLLAEPDAFQALGGGEVVLRLESPSGIHIRGGASDQTTYVLDGIPIFSPYHAAGVFSAWNPDALSELRLSSSVPSPAYPDALSGVVAAVSRAPGARLRAQGGVSTTQARLTLDGPLGVAGAGYLVSLRSGFPGVFAPKHEASYVQGETGDWLAKLEAPALGGWVRAVGYGSSNEIGTAATVAAENAPTPDARRNVFEWLSQSAGAEWQRAFSSTSVRLLAWSAAGQAGSVWDAQIAPVHLTSARRDEGLLAAVEHFSSHATTVAGIRVERSRTSYRIDSDSTPEPSWDLSARTPVATAFAQHTRRIGDRMAFKVGASLAAHGRDLHLGPRAQLRWQVSQELALAGSYARLHQFAQSLRNAESVVGNVFPVDLYMGSGAAGIPVARSHQGVLAVDYRPVTGVHFGAQVYARGSDGLVLVAPRDGEPFTTGAFVVGSGASRGMSVHGAVSAARYGIVASYGLQRVRLSYADSSYVPDHGAAHLFEGGVTVFPTATSSIRLGVAGALGRRTTPISGGLEWEACNLLDQGCEFAGSPHYDGQRLGATPLPHYLRVDLGLRQHWHLGVAGRDVVMALFGTVTNVLRRKNVLTYTTDPATDRLVEIEMRPLAPLVVGLDWRF
ncbi:MAG: carboxypeptidase regulatory-like domain-containing protein [Gemmatimonadales bacterium]